MPAIWFCLAALLLAGYVVLDGYDLGAGIVQLFIARNEAERRQILQSIRPFWDANEVWLIAAGGTLYFAFPGLYASSFSGFYLPLMMILWLLILRGVSIEFRGHVESPVWKPLWGAVFAAASSLLALFFGATMGNVVRGAPLDRQGDFFLPLWTDFRIAGQVAFLDWYTALVAATAFCALLLHGALWIRLKTDGPISARSWALARKAWWALAALALLTTVASFRLQPHLAQSFAGQPWGYAFPALAAAGLCGTRLLRSEGKAFLCSSLFLVGILGCMAFGLFPYLLPSNTDPKLGLTVYNTAPALYGLRLGLVWWIPGMLLATGYSIYIHCKFAGKVHQF